MNADDERKLTERLSPLRAKGLTPEPPKWNHAQRRAFARYMAREQARVERRLERKAAMARAWKPKKPEKRKRYRYEDDVIATRERHLELVSEQRVAKAKRLSRDLATRRARRIARKAGRQR